MVFFVVAVRPLVTYVYVRSLRGARYALIHFHHNFAFAYTMYEINH